MLELFQKILKDGLTPNQLLLLFGTNESISFQIHDGVKALNHDISTLLKLKLIQVDASIVMGDAPERTILTQQGKRLCAKYDNYFAIAKKRTTNQLLGKGYNEMIKMYREAFPAGKLPSGKPGRQNIKTLENAFRWFFETYDYTWDEITNATVMYLREYEENNYMYMKTSQYFICKSDKNKVKISELADYCDMIKDGVVIESKDYFKEKVV